MLGALAPSAASAGPAANRVRSVLSDAYDRCLQVSCMCSWCIPSEIRNMLAHMTYGNTTYEQTLKQLLLQKGVPSRVVDQRVQAAIKAIGAPKLRVGSRALTCLDVWSLWQTRRSSVGCCVRSPRPCSLQRRIVLPCRGPRRPQRHRPSRRAQTLGTSRIHGRPRRPLTSQKPLRT